MCPKLIELLSQNGPTVHVCCFMSARASTKTFVSRIHIRQPSPKKTAKKFLVSRKFRSQGHSLAEVTLYIYIYIQWSLRHRDHANEGQTVAKQRFHNTYYCIFKEYLVSRSPKRNTQGFRYSAVYCVYLSIRFIPVFDFLSHSKTATNRASQRGRGNERDRDGKRENSEGR